MKSTYLLALILIIFTAQTNAKTDMKPTDVVAKFLSHMKDKEYSEASSYVANAELEWLSNSSRELFVNEELMEIIGIEILDKDGIKSLSNAEVFAIMSIGTWEHRDKNFGEFGPEYVLGSVFEKPSLAHVVVRDFTNSDIDAFVLTLVLEENVWRLKLPRIMKATVEIFNRMYR